MSVMIAFRVSEDLKARMQEAAQAEGLTLTAWITKAVEQRVLLGEQWPEAVQPDWSQTTEALHDAVATIGKRMAQALPPSPRTLARMEREETQRNCRHPLNRRIGKACPVCGKDPV